MLANKDYLDLPKHFWAHVKFLSGVLGYSERGTNKLKTYNKDEILEAMNKKGLDTSHLLEKLNDGRVYIEVLVGYLNFRSRVIEKDVESNLMTREDAKKIFDELLVQIKPKCKLPMNKQKGKKRHNAYLTGIVNMLTEQTLGSCNFEDDPQTLTVATFNKRPLRTFTRRFDGVYPNSSNPVAVWEIKEYYGTTTFGSRVADGIYETMLDGKELLELKESENIHIKHYLMVDDRYTWWNLGRSYICRIVDMLHEEYVDEVLFGKEVVNRWPDIVKSWGDVTK
ncbi:hypothetical protein HYZ05_01240 [Candidatus Daviesbacteria bacterium]|nr:hypothetical protein [Candidatus Daviesbacteria bacterium]